MNIHTIDLNFCNQAQCFGAYLVESNGELALIESGPASAAENLETGIRDLGFDPGDVKKVLVTHIHLDHAGAAGWWAARGARIYVHERGARHLIDPAKLIKGARMVYGDELETRWGEIQPVAESRLTALNDGDSVQVGSTTIQVWDTPGHARHHHAYVMEGVAFTGDVAGVRLPGQIYISPTTAPSQFDPDAYIASIHRLASAKLDRLYLTHFGPVEDVAEHLWRYEAIVREAAALLGGHFKDGASREKLAAVMEEFNHARAEAEHVDQPTWECYENANPSGMCADGIALYWKRQQSESS